MANAFDMNGTIEFYSNNIDRIRLPCRKAEKNSVKVKGELRDIEVDRLNALRALYPSNSLERSVFEYVVAKPETWFLPDAESRIRGGKNPVTTASGEAMSQTSIVPSYFNPVSWENGEIWLFDIPKEAVRDSRVREIILSEGFIHELAHSINFISRYKGDGQKLRFPNGKILTGKEAFESFGEIALKHEPMSHYSSGYFPGRILFDSASPDRTIDEELCETIAAYLLGFSYTPSESRRFSPFADRPEILAFVKDYLNAKLIF